MSEKMAQRIKNLRLEKRLTLEQVANVVGVGKSTVRKWETGIIANMKRDKIAILAEALGTTPEYLMGWSENEETSSTGLSDAEKEWLSLFREVPEESKGLLLETFKTFRKIPQDHQPEALNLLQVALRMQQKSE